VKWCRDHWDAIRKAVADRGMEHLAAPSAEQAHADFAAQLEGEEERFDPVMGSMWRLTHRVLENVSISQGPAAVLSAFGDPDWCPMCAVQQSYEEYLRSGQKVDGALDAQGWITNTVDSALAHARESGIINPS
jgi:hypothetical protein